MPSWKKVITSGSAAELSSLYAPSITGSLLGTASYANNANSASYALTASYAATANSASYALSASYATTATLSERTTQTDILVLNQTGYAITKGMVVRITSSGNSSDIPRVVSASYENDNNSANTLGIALENITNGSQGFVITEGILKGVDTSNYASGQLVYLGATGSITGSAPQAPLHTVRLGEVVRSQSNQGSIYVRIDNGQELGELHDVRDTTTTSSYGDMLVKSGSIWTNSRQLTGSYGLTGSLTATSFTGSLNGTSSWAQNAVTASYILNAVSASYALSASFAVSSSRAVSASFATTASHAISASYAPDTTFPYTGSAIISGSLIVTGSTRLYNSGSNILSVSGSQGSFTVDDDLTGDLLIVQSGSRQIMTVSSSGLTTLYGVGASTPVFLVTGSTGALLTITDNNTGIIFNVSDSASSTIFDVNSNSTVRMGNSNALALYSTARATSISGSNIIYNVPTATYDGAWFDYTVRSGSNARAGQIMAIWSGSSVNFTETTASSFGDTSGIAFTVIVTGSNMALTGSSTTAGWTIKTIVRGI